MPSIKKIKSPQQIWENISSVFVEFVERIFYTLGVFVAKHPWRTIVATWAFVLLSCGGLLTFHIEKNPMKLWVPPDSDFFYDTNWYINNFGTNFRLQKLLITADNVLDSNVIQLIYNISSHVSSLKVEHQNKVYTLNDLCFKVPVVNFASTNWKSRSDESMQVNNSKPLQKRGAVDEDLSDPSLWIDEDFYCSFLESFPLVCLQYNIIDMFKRNATLINNATNDDIITNINNIRINPSTGHPVDFTQLLGGIELDEAGKVVSAKSILLTWYMYVNMTQVDLNEVGNLVGTEDWVSIPLALWELEYLKYVKSLSFDDNNIKFYYEAGRSFADTSGETMFQDMDKLFIGIVLMFFYVVMAVSRFNWLEIRLTLGSIGLLNVGMAYITTIGWCSLMGIPFGPVHSSLPFLLMGLGVDDMFVMNACWKIVLAEDSQKNIHIKVGHMLKHAGVSIVITSFTDIVALLIGAITILPSLKSFCIYAAVGVFFIFCFSVTFYVAVFTLDIRRVEQKRNGILLCYKHKTEISLPTEKTIFQRFLESIYRNIVLTTPGKTIILLFTLGMTCFSVVSILKLEQRFDPKWFIPDGTYYKDFLNVHEYYYPDEGQPATVFLGDMDYSVEFVKLYDMIQVLRNESYVTEVNTWVETFHGYVHKNYDLDLKNSTAVSSTQFNKYLSRFLFSPVGGRFQINFKFKDPLTCGHVFNNITASSLAFRFTRFEGPEEYVPAMNRVKEIVKSTNITTGSGYRSVWSKVFANWVTDEIIGVEVERNIELALFCVMICTVILITNLQMCLWIFVCVMLTIVNVLGWMQRWGMTVDIVCCIGLELAIGLCVDYAAHVGHTFLTISQGSRNERAFKTVTSIGTAVLLGGGSTLLSLSLLSMSKAYTFQSFFKIFLLVILFGLSNGLLFLPVVLSLIGPAAYRPHDKKDGSPEGVELNGKFSEKEKQIDED
ncbi:NPC intracellular cholesterol transporter 1-like [Vanessa cardui]|uniref:NPC intracellular cholesterol transporter 1-like n=1 Tax=Vanessa cardui TaxID=171605 RepID=UPI001F12E81F|nr:NPC intracellular cholesterol transporter 1-like [Vanessa cardui]